MNETSETIPGSPPCTVYHRSAQVNGVRLHYVATWPQAEHLKGNARVVCALHGFPEFWYSWVNQIPALAAAGFQVAAPDQRGYNLSAKPAGVRHYRLELLTKDIVELIRSFGVERAVVAGHDWGGGIAWNLALRYPQVVEKLIILNAPHPGAFMRELRTRAQLLKSWYMFFFQLPLVPETVFRLGDWALLERTFRRGTVNPGVFTEEDIRQYKQAMARPGALTAAINWYRAAFRYSLRSPVQELPPILAPTMLIWGEQDRFLGVRLTEGLERWVPNLRVERIPQAGHWVQWDAATQVNRLMIEFLRPLAGIR